MKDVSSTGSEGSEAGAGVAEGQSHCTSKTPTEVVYSSDDVEGETEEWENAESTETATGTATRMADGARPGLVAKEQSAAQRTETVDSSAADSDEWERAESLSESPVHRAGPQLLAQTIASSEPGLGLREEGALQVSPFVGDSEDSEEWVCVPVSASAPAAKQALAYSPTCSQPQNPAPSSAPSWVVGVSGSGSCVMHTPPLIPLPSGPNQRSTASSKSNCISVAYDF